jgi:hypothetical protein
MGKTGAGPVTRRCFVYGGFIASNAFNPYASGSNTEQEFDDYPYDAAWYSSGRRSTGGKSLAVFPFRSEAFRIGLPFEFGRVAYGPDGKALYAQIRNEPNAPDWPRLYRPGLFRIDLHSLGVSPVLGSLDLGINGLAISRDEGTVIVSGGVGMGSDASCGIYEISRGKATLLIENPKCGYVDSWTDLSIAPDGSRVLATRNRRLEIIDLIQKTSRPLGGNLLYGTWSPDGNWIAAVDSGETHVVLLDTDGLAPKKVLKTVDVRWSPDSRYLLAWKGHLLCGPYSGTLEATNITTAKTSIIKSSSCRVNQSTIGWVSRGIAPTSNKANF